MRNLATKLEPNLATQVAGYVVAAGATGSAGLVVRCDDGDVTARRAASCLLAPERGDRVLVALFGDGSAYVLAVLDRADDAEAATLSVDGDLALRLPSGRLDVVAAGGVNLVSGEQIAMVSPTVEVKAAEGRFGVDRLTMIGTHLLAEVATVKTVAGVIDQVADRFSQRVKRVYRFVEELDQLKAKRVDYTAEKTMHLHGENTLMTADELVKFDGEHIHMG